jgi:hypothetical protein
MYNNGTDGSLISIALVITHQVAVIGCISSLVVDQAFLLLFDDLVYFLILLLTSVTILRYFLVI